jgi:tRNA(Ile)-lysidine synthase
MWLIARWRIGEPDAPRASVLTVDHGLRPSSAAEAAQVEAAARAIDLPAAILVWRGRKPKTGLQAAAREARYRLVTAWCEEHDAPALLTAHTLDDQAETFLMRLARGSGVDGLSGIGSSKRGRTAILRPLIHIPRARLRATLEAAGQSWIEDPSNENERFERVRWRRVLQVLAAEGLSARSIALAARRIERARRALQAATADLASSAVTNEAGTHKIDASKLAAAPEELRVRLLEQVLEACGGGTRAPELAAVERLAAWLDGGAGRARTLAGCRIARRGGILTVRREPPRKGAQRAAGRP